MAISSVGSTSYSDINALATPAVSKASSAADTAKTSGATQTDPSGSAVSNNSSLSTAIQQALAQIKAGGDLSGLLNPDSQQSSSDFLSNLYSSLPGLSSSGDASSDPFANLPGSANRQAATPVQLDQSSATIKLQTSIQKLISQLDGNNNASNLFGDGSNTDASAGFGNLQQSFNTLLTASGGDPSQTSLQSFLKTVASSIQSSLSIGSLFDTSA